MESRFSVRRSLRTKLLVSLMLITLVPLAILNFISYQTVKAQIADDMDAQLSGFSKRVARAIDIIMDQRISDVSGWTALDTVTTAIELGSELAFSPGKTLYLLKNSLGCPAGELG